jgi:hypothetical protein
MARDLVRLSHRLQGWLLQTASLLRVWAAGVEPTTYGYSDCGRYLSAGQATGTTGFGRHWLQHRIQQGLRVGVRRRGEQPLYRCHLHDFAQIHHHDPQADLAHRVQVVRHKQNRHVHLLLQLAQQGVYLSADGQV